MDPSFVLRHPRKLTCLSDCDLRRDLRFPFQTYFMTKVRTSFDKYNLYLSQVLAASPNQPDQSVHAVDFWKRKLGCQPSSHPNFRFAIDEKDAKLYISFGHQEDGRPDAESKLRVFDLKFDPADHLGYRRVRVQPGDRLFVVRPAPAIEAYIGALLISPETGKLYGHYVVPKRNGSASVVAQLEQPKAGTIRARLCKQEFNSYNATTDLNPRCFMYSKLNHLLILYAFPFELDRPQANESVYLWSYDSNLSVIRCLAFNPVDLVSQFFTSDEMWGFYQFRPPGISKAAAIGCYLDIMGFMHKYVLFIFQTFILAVKWPKDWYSGKTLPKVQLSRIIRLEDFTKPDEVYRIIRPVAPTALTEKHLHVVFNLRNKPEEIRRLALSPGFKDYRRCANCGEIEKRKRRNKDGKRIAEFKVCRLCKKRNLHLFYLDPKLACHYCSDECQKLHWKTHKVVHKRSQLNRKTASAKTVEEKL